MRRSAAAMYSEEAKGEALNHADKLVMHTLTEAYKYQDRFDVLVLEATADFRLAPKRCLVTRVKKSFFVKSTEQYFEYLPQSLTEEKCNEVVRLMTTPMSMLRSFGGTASLTSGGLGGAGQGSLHQSVTRLQPGSGGR